MSADTEGAPEGNIYTSNSGGGLDAGGVAAIILAILLFGVLVGGGVYIHQLKRRQRAFDALGEFYGCMKCCYLGRDTCIETTTNPTFFLNLLLLVRMRLVHNTLSPLFGATAGAEVSLVQQQSI